ncbi:MAG: TrmH family RNA methyltransferase [Bacteroidales bacterium]
MVAGSTLSKSLIKQIRSLELKKNRNETKLFLVEGTKAVKEFLNNKWEVYCLITTEKWAKEHLSTPSYKIYVVDKKEIEKISLQKTPQEVIAVFKQIAPQYPQNIEHKLGIALDALQDAGNVGTIIRLSLWFGFDYVFFSENTVDPYNPKVIQATMGALAKTTFYRGSLSSFLTQYADKTSVYGTFTDGENIYNAQLSQSGIVVFGNEGNGISDNIKSLIQYKLSIPPYPSNSNPLDSLNVATAAAIVCSEFRRRNI